MEENRWRNRYQAAVRRLHHQSGQVGLISQHPVWTMMIKTLQINLIRLKTQIRHFERFIICLCRLGAEERRRVKKTMKKPETPRLEDTENTTDCSNWAQLSFVWRCPNLKRFYSIHIFFHQGPPLKHPVWWTLQEPATHYQQCLLVLKVFYTIITICFKNLQSNQQTAN